jgi:hypothetical protein
LAQIGRLRNPLWSPPLPVPDDADPDTLISRLAGPLPLDARSAFRAAAEAALAQVPCWGEGACYRAVSVLQRAYFVPPDDDRAGWDIASGTSTRPSKMRSAPPIEHGRDFRFTRHLRLAR